MSKLNNLRVHIAIATASIMLASFSVCAAQTMPNMTNNNTNTNTNTNTNRGGNNTNTNTNINMGPSNPIVSPAYSYQTYQTYTPTRPWSYVSSASYSYAYPSYYYPQSYAAQNYVALSQIPYTGFDFGPWGNAIYWLGLIAFALAGAYLVTYYSKGTLLSAKSIIRNWALRLDSLRGSRSW